MVTWKPEPTAETLLDSGVSLAGLVVVGEDLRLTSEEVATATTLTAEHFFVKVKSGATITLPPAVNHKDRVYIIKNVGEGSVVVDANSSEKIDGDLTVVLGLQYDFVTIVSDAVEWFIIGGRNVKIEELVKEQISLLEQMLQELKDIRYHQDLADETEIRGSD